MMSKNFVLVVACGAAAVHPLENSHPVLAVSTRIGRRMEEINV